MPGLRKNPDARQRGKTWIISGVLFIVGLVMNVELTSNFSFEERLLRSVMTAVTGECLDPDPSGPDEAPGPVVWNIPGFGGKNRVGTAFGDLPIEALRLRDEIRTSAGSMVRVKWIDKLHLDADFIKKHPDALPIRIPANCFGRGRPMKDMLVAPRQELCVDAHVATRFQTALDLYAQARAHRVQQNELTYYRFHCGEPVCVRVEGVWVRN